MIVGQWFRVQLALAMAVSLVAPLESQAGRAVAGGRGGLGRVTMLADVRAGTAPSRPGITAHRRTSRGPLPGYEANRIYLRREPAEALARVQKRLMSGGMGLKVFDGYRPVRATLAMVEWAKRTENTALLTGGFVSSKSRHNLGLAVDLTLVDWSVGGREVDMGTPWDSFTDQAHWANATGRTKKYRELLRRVMEAEGFKQYEQEWWHYSYDVAGDTPAFDVVVGAEGR
jgi:D-alanyl-D-alanine dipeptidase